MENKRMRETNLQPHHSSSSHNPVQKSTTLNRRYVHRPCVANAKKSAKKIEINSHHADTVPVRKVNHANTMPANDSEFINRFIASAQARDLSKKVVQSTPKVKIPVSTGSKAIQATSELNNKITQPVTPIARTSRYSTRLNNRITQPVSRARLARIRTANYQSQPAAQPEIAVPTESETEKCPDNYPENHTEDYPCNNAFQSAISERMSGQSCTDDTECEDATSAYATSSAKNLLSQAQEKPANPADSKTLSQAISAISDDSTTDRPTRHKTPKVKRSGSAKRFIIAFTSACACVAALAFFIHLNMPDMSLRVAAMQTGIEASYPAYVPRDYQLTSVYTEEEGAVVLEFTGAKNEKFNISETKSSWDSSALLTNFVKKRWNDNYSTIREQGITIYVAGSSAVWVNGGVFYYISPASDTTLTKKQLKNIAVSL